MFTKSEIRNPKLEGRRAGRAVSEFGRRPSTFGFPPRTAAAFTLIELILVMTILTIAVSITAPALANFFRGRSLDSEARRLLALAREGRSRAVSEGLPVELWFNRGTGTFGLEAEPSYEAVDPKALEFKMDADMQLELFTGTNSVSLMPALARTSSSTLTTSGAQIISRHPELPSIRFLPDGSLGENSPQAIKLTGRDGLSIWLVQSRNRMDYELRNRME